MKAAASGEITSYENRHSAFEVVEWAIYLFAIVSVVLDSHVLRMPATAVRTTYLMIAAAFFLVAVRNYIVMQSIDKNQTTKFENYHFVEVQKSGWSFFERTLRLSIISVVVLTPKAFPVLVEPMRLVGTGLENIVRSIGGYLDVLPRTSDLDPVFHANLLYYGAVLFTIALLSVLWDLVAVLYYCLSKDRDTGEMTRLNPGVDLDSPAVANSVYRSLLMYMNTYKIRTRSAYFSIPAFQWFRPLLEDGSGLRVYLLSWKFLERCLVGGFSLCLVSAAVSNMSGPIDITLGVFLCAYVFAALQNQRYLEDMFGFITFPLWYFIRRQSVEPALLPKLETGALTPQQID